MTTNLIENFHSRTRTDGIIEAVWTENGKTRRRSTGTRNKSDAKAELSRIEVDVRAPRVPADPTVEWICETHLENLRANRPQANHTPTAGSLASIKKRLGNLRASQIKQSTVDRNGRERMQDTRWADHKNSGYRQQGTISSATVQRELRMLRAAMNAAKAEGHIPEKPTFKINFASSAPKERWLERHEAKRLLDACYPEQILRPDGKVDYRNRDRSHLAGFILISLATAARKEAVLELTWDQIHIPHRDNLGNKGLLDFDQGSVNGEVYINFGQGNGNKRRPRMPISNNFPLVSWLIFNKPQKNDDRYSGEGLNRVITFRGELVKDIKKSLAAVAKEARVEDITPHTLKHTSITWMFQSGFDFFEISKLTNTSMEVLEQHYAHFRPESSRKIGSNLAVT